MCCNVLCYAKFFSEIKLPPRMIFRWLAGWFSWSQRYYWNVGWFRSLWKYLVIKIYLLNSDVNGFIKAFFDDDFVSFVYRSLLRVFQLKPLTLELDCVVVVHFASRLY